MNDMGSKQARYNKGAGRLGRSNQANASLSDHEEDGNNVRDRNNDNRNRSQTTRNKSKGNKREVEDDNNDETRDPSGNGRTVARDDHKEVESDQVVESDHERRDGQWRNKSTGTTKNKNNTRLNQDDDEESEDNVKNELNRKGDNKGNTQDEEQSPEVLGARLVNGLKMRRLGPVRMADILGATDEIDEEQTKKLGLSIAEKLPEVEEHIESQIQLIDLGAAEKPANEGQRRRNGIFIKDEDFQNAIAAAAVQLVTGNKALKAAKVGTFSLKVVCILGGVALVLGGVYLSVMMLNGKPAELTYNIVEAMYNAADKLDNAVDKKLEQRAKETQAAKQLLKLVGPGMELTEAMLKEFEHFKLAVAGRLASGKVEKLE
ncbi:hypothetical protein FOVSG1_010104 [Fusarium oxysporum f. sp. vasinfectum]